MKIISKSYAFSRKAIWHLLLKLRFVKNDAIVVKVEYFLRTGRILNLKNPKRFNDKLQWLKLYHKNPNYTERVDKYDIKKIVANKIGSEYVIPTYGIWKSFDEIDFDLLPNQFVLKCTHDSGGIVICMDKAKLDKEKARKKIEKCLKRKYFYEHREYPYKDVKPRVIAEKYLVDESGLQLKDYKIFCFNGEPKFIEVDYNRYFGHKLNVYDLDWNFVDFYMTSPNDRNVKIPRPNKLDKMLDFARILSKNDVFTRVDFYSIENNIYFGELTYTPGAGMIDFHPDEYDFILGEMLQLPK